jgi:hypothetical protein
MNSFYNDSSRIVLLGLVLEFSRYVTRQALQNFSPAFDKKRLTEDSEQCRCEYGKVGLAHDKCEQCERIRLNQCSLSERLVGRIKHFSLVYRYIALGSWLFLSPTILLLCSSKMNSPTNSIASAGSTYLSSVFTSVGVVLCLYPEIISSSQSRDVDATTTSDEYENQIALDLTAKQSNLQTHTPPKPQLPPLPIPRKDPEEEYRLRSDSLLSQNTEISTQAQKQYLEMLVHNVSHTDLILGLSDDEADKAGLFNLEPRLSIDSSHTTPRSKNPPTNGSDEDNHPDEEKYILCRPRFSAFDMFSRRVKTELLRCGLSNPIISYPRYERIWHERSNATPRYTLATPRPGDESMLPVGFNLEKTSMPTRDEAEEDELLVSVNDMPSLRVRGRDISKINPVLLGDSPRRVSVMSPGPTVTHSEAKVMESLRINAVFFPLMSTLLPRWLGQIADKYGLGKSSTNVKKVIVLVSGVGSPRNWTHSISGNSTQICSDLMEMFIRELYPDVAVIK